MKKLKYKDYQNATKEPLEQMAKAGYEQMFEDKWDDLSPQSIDRNLWIGIAKKMLKAVRFPAELYRLHRKLFFEGDLNA